MLWASHFPVYRSRSSHSPRRIRRLRRVSVLPSSEALGSHFVNIRKFFQTEPLKPLNLFCPTSRVTRTPTSFGYVMCEIGLLIVAYNYCLYSQRLTWAVPIYEHS
ncbi:hypothetical protein NE237_005581 [Protea cynaroides]|uniref:Uncharacterized protein n=1 Tax=Protea cynaroides TaxID=273540 RepID=A0A9Q0JS72_9MAGN|nr:hypothetical protein NE237_005581 [Protea cynaroides]